MLRDLAKERHPAAEHVRLTLRGLAGFFFPLLAPGWVRLMLRGLAGFFFPLAAPGWARALLPLPSAELQDFIWGWAMSQNVYWCRRRNGSTMTWLVGYYQLFIGTRHQLPVEHIEI